jgi:GTPase
MVDLYKPTLRECHMSLDPDWQETLENLNDMQAQLDRERAQLVLRDLLDHDLSQREKGYLAAELAEMENWLERLERSTIQIAVFGLVGRGKSSVLNALIGREAFTTGALHGVTQRAEQVTWQVADWEDDWGLDMPTTIKEQIEFFDTPGIDEVAGIERARIAWSIAKQVDILLFVVAGDVTEIERQALAELREVGKPILLVFNKVDRYSELDLQEIYQKITTDRVKELLTPNEIVLVAAAPVVQKLVRHPDGREEVITERGVAQVDKLKSKILEVLEREGKSLVALNSMISADRLQAKVLHHKMGGRERQADDRIWQAVMTKAVAVALNPITALDLIGGAAIDLGLILSLSQVYGLPMTKGGALQLFRTIILGMGGVAGGEILMTLGLSGLKGLLGASVPVTGGLAAAPYTAIAIAQATAAGVATYSIGQITKTYLANGANWHRNSPKNAVGEILQTIDEDSIVSRIKQELQGKLARQS